MLLLRRDALSVTLMPPLQPACPVCHIALTIDLEAPAIEVDEEQVKARQGILGRLDLNKWRSSSKIEALIEELSNLRKQDATTKSIVFSQFVNFLDLIAYRLQRAGFTVGQHSLHGLVQQCADVWVRSAAWRAR